MAKRTISKRTEHMRLMEQLSAPEAKSLLDSGPITFMEFVPTDDITPLEVAQSVRAEFLSGLKQEAEKAEEMATFLRRTVQQFEQEPVPQTMQEMLDNAVGSYDNTDDITVQDLKDILADYYYKKADPLRILRLWHDLFRAIALLGDAENVAAGKPTLRERLKQMEPK